jgi:hypothetical protein
MIKSIVEYIRYRIAIIKRSREVKKQDPFIYK